MTLAVGRIALLLAFVSACVYAEEHRPAEGVVCRSYGLARKNGMLGPCMKLWRNADVSELENPSMDCKRCKAHLKNEMFFELTKRSPNAGIGSDDIQRMTSQLVNNF